MSIPVNTQTDLSLVPLGAGDLIDRAVRFYRRYFWTFVLIASPPVIVGRLFLWVGRLWGGGYLTNGI